MIRNIVSNLLYLIPRELRYEICRHHANKAYAENHSDFRTNGELWLLQKVLPDTKTVFDVGSFTGEWAAHALRINPNIALHCFEPSRKSFNILQGKAFGHNVTRNPFGLGSKNRQAPFFVYDELSEGNSLYRRRGIERITGSDPQIKTEMVEIRTLNSYCLEKDISEIDLIKIDVEGHELAVVQGADTLFENESIKMVMFEYGGTYIESRALLRDFFDFFGALNYSLYLLYPKKLCLIPRYDQRLENFQYKNFVVVNNQVVKQRKMFQHASII